MVNTICNSKPIKATPEPAEQVPLDYLYTKRTVPEKKPVLYSDFRKSKTRFPDDDRWHTRDFERFANFCTDVKFHYRGIDYLGELISVDSGIFRPRWSRDYQRLCMGRCYRFGEGCKSEYGNPDGTISGHFVTLTVWHRTSGSYQSMRETVEKLNTVWRSIYKWVYRRGWRFLRVMEPGENNHYPHFHMIIVGAKDEEIEEFKQHWVENCQSKGVWASIKAQDSKFVTDIRNPGAYIIKYIAKSFGDDESCDDDEWYWRWQELCYRECNCKRGFHVYAMDRKTSKYITEYYGHRKPSGVKGEMEIITPEKDRENQEKIEKKRIEGILEESRDLGRPAEKAEDLPEYAFALKGDVGPDMFGSEVRLIVGRGSGGEFTSPLRERRGADP